MEPAFLFAGLIRMTEKHFEQTATTHSAHPEKRLKRKPGVGNFFEKNGAFDGKLFLSKDRVTYTFLFENEAIALHLDASKRDVFVRGHRVTHLDPGSQNAIFMQRFCQALASEPKAKDHLQMLNDVLEEIS